MNVPVRVPLPVLGGVFLVVVLAAAAAHAHEVGLSRGLYVATDGGFDVELQLARPEVDAALHLDSNGDGAIDDAELAAGAVEPFAVRALRIDVDGAACALRFAGASLTEADGLALRLEAACPTGARKTATATAAFLSSMAAGHRHLAHVVVDGAEADRIALAAEPSFALDAATPAPMGAMVRVGVEHILLGFDHLAFLFGLLLVGGRLRSLLGVITAFTVAHSITLALAVLGVWAPSPSIVEPAIALSIAYVGVENFFVKDAERRWRVTAPFGLIHGFGFAGALAEVGVPDAQVPLALLLFNAGVELGQLVVVAAVLPAIVLLSRRPGFVRVGRPALSVIVVLLGVGWFIQRAFLS